MAKITTLKWCNVKTHQWKNFTDLKTEGFQYKYGMNNYAAAITGFKNGMGQLIKFLQLPEPLKSDLANIKLSTKGMLHFSVKQQVIGQVQTG